MKQEGERMKEIQLVNGGVAFVDDEDFEKVRGYRWRSSTRHNTTYARTCNKGRTLLMHRLIMDAPPGTVVDHRDSNGLNNCRQNLRLCTNQQNLWNRKKGKKRGHSWSPYIGVCVTQTGRYTTQVSVDGKPVYFGCFTNERDAALMYDAVVRRTRSEFATLNFPDEHPSEEELQRRRITRDGAKKVAATP